MITAMSVLTPWQIVLVILASWINRQQLEVIEYLQEENRVLRELSALREIPRLEIVTGAFEVLGAKFLISASLLWMPWRPARGRGLR